VKAVIASIPPLVRVGLGLLAFGGAADIGYHAVNGLDTHTHAGVRGVAFMIHVVAALGMAVSMLGLLGEGIRSTRRSAAGRRNK
jgi:hypothetical protein